MEAAYDVKLQEMREAVTKATDKQCGLDLVKETRIKSDQSVLIKI